MTDEPMPELIERLRKLEAAATKGPWFWKQGYEMHYRVSEDDEDDAGFDLGDNIETRQHWGVHNAESDAAGRVITCDLVSLSSGRAHGEFGFLDNPDVLMAVAARNAMPRLLAEVARLTSDNERMAAALRGCVENWGKRDVFLLPEEVVALERARAALDQKGTP